jgi:prolyl 4-hydroxylase
MNAPAADLEHKAATGDGAAQLALGRTHEEAGRHDRARAWYARAASGGTFEAGTALGISLLIHEPQSPYDGIKAIIDASNAGCGQAAHIAAVMAAAGSGLPQDWNLALNCLRRSAELGWPLAQGQLALLAGETAPPATPDIWKTLQDRVDIGPWSNLPASRRMFETPRIATVEKFLTPAICDWLIERARPRIARAKVYDDATGAGRLDAARSNSATDFNIAEADIVIALVRARIAALTGLPTAGMEHTSVLHYAVGQEFTPHFDFLDPAIAAYAPDLAGRGQRVATVLVYLNDDFDGAETAFLNLDWKYKGNKGDALLFWNVDPSGQPDRKTRHAGLAPTRGEKWLLSQWIRVPRAAGA